MRERPFTNEVIALARDHNWDVFHIHDQDSYENYRKVATGAGYPDWDNVSNRSERRNINDNRRAQDRCRQ